MINIIMDIYNLCKKDTKIKMPKLHRQKQGLYRCKHHGYIIPYIWKSRCKNITSSTCELCDIHCKC